MVELMKLARDDSAMREFQGLLNAYKQNPEKWNKIYTYNTYNKDWYYVDGELKIAFVKRGIYYIIILQSVLCNNVTNQNIKYPSVIFPIPSIHEFIKV